MKSLMIIPVLIFSAVSAQACPTQVEKGIAESSTYDMRNLRRQECNTGRGSWGQCLVPYVSVAADKRLYDYGDIIYIPALKGKQIQFQRKQSAGSKVQIITKTHPGYLIVEDTGSGVKGKGRFDFFTGDISPDSNKNSFGRTSDAVIMMAAPEDCSPEKNFKVIQEGDPEYFHARREIERLAEMSNVPRDKTPDIYKAGKSNSSGNSGRGVN